MRALHDFWTGLRWSETECGCAFTVFGPRRVRTCLGHDYAGDLIAVQLTGSRR